MTDNQKNTLPKNWELKTLGEVAKSTKGKKPINLSETQTDFFSMPYIDIKAFEKKIFREFTDGEKCNLCNEDDVLLVWDGARCGFVGRGVKGAIGSTLAKIVSNSLDKSFLFYFLQSNFLTLNTNVRGAGIPHIEPYLLWNLPLSLPPLPEQQKIVQKIESLFTELETGTKALKTALNQLKIYRQAVLNHFLTNDNWKTVKLGDVCDRIFDGPFGSNLKSSDYTSSGVQVVRLENIGFMEFFEDKETFVSEDKYQSLIKHEVFEGDIIFSSFIGDYIRTTILPNLKYKAIAKADCFCVRPKEKFIDKQFLTFVLSSTRTQKILVLAVHGATRPRINTTQLKSFSFPLPSLEIQTQIVAEIEKRMVAADALEASLKSQLIKAENLRQSILKRAFEGKLV